MSRVVSLCFDDGFLATAGTVRRIFEARGLRASFCVLAAPQEVRDALIASRPLGDWAFWREAAAAGHEVAPHGWAHERLARTPLAKACASLDRTLEVFARELPGFEARKAVFHLAHLAAPEPVVEHLRGRVLGVRRAVGRDALNALHGRATGADIDCVTYGEAVDERLLARLDRFVREETGWLVLVLHGVDGEGWGPVRSETLELALDRLMAAGVRVAPTGKVLVEAIEAAYRPGGT